MHARMRERIHFVHYKRRCVALNLTQLHKNHDFADHTPASEKCQQEKRKTVNGEDILFAMTSTGFENYAEALKIYLAKYREVSCPLSFPLLAQPPAPTNPHRDPSINIETSSRNRNEVITPKIARVARTELNQAKLAAQPRDRLQQQRTEAATIM